MLTHRFGITAKPSRKPVKKRTAQEKAIAVLMRQPKGDRERAFLPFADGALLIDDGGGVPVECFDDAVATHHFLVWLRLQRAARRNRTQAAAMAYRVKELLSAKVVPLEKARAAMRSSRNRSRLKGKPQCPDGV